MSDNNYKDYDYESQYEDENYDWEQMDEQQPDDMDKSVKGYRVAIIILTVILAALSVLYFSIYHQQRDSMAFLATQKEAVEESLTDLMYDFSELEVENSAIADSLNMERMRADSIITQLKRERTFNYNKLRQYEKQVGVMRTLMQGYLRQIDSLNTLNEKLISENVSYRKEITSAQLRAEMAEERVDELDVQIRQGSIIRATTISISMLNERGNEVSRARRAATLRTNFVLAANELSDPGNRVIYLRLISPDGFVITTESLPTFSFEGELMTYTASREVDFQGVELPVSIFFGGEGFNEGLYKVELYSGGYLIGQGEVELR
ncbi:MAG: hypothetical protein SNJ33_02290 [Rikenellaceae bacterium]